MAKGMSLWCPLCEELVAGFGRNRTIGQMAQHIANKHPDLAEAQRETLARRPWRPQPLAEALTVAHSSEDHGSALACAAWTVATMTPDERGRSVRRLFAAVAANVAAVPAMFGFVALGGVVLAGRAVAERHSRKQSRSNLAVAVSTAARV
jgi:hypothetical protein